MNELFDYGRPAAVELAVDVLRRRGKIVVVGIGKSGNVGRKIAATLTSTGSTSVVLNSVDALHGDLGIVTDGDLIIALSYSGESDELLNLVPALKRFSVKIIAITGADNGNDLVHGPFRILDDGVAPPAAPGVSTRIGLSPGRGDEHLWRFFVPGDPNLSR